MTAVLPTHLPRGHGELATLLRLAVPLVALRAGTNLMSVVDTMVAGRISPEAVAAVGLGGAAWFMVFVLPFGFLLGLDPLISHAVGEGDRRRWLDGLVTGRWLAVALAIPTVAVVLLLPDVLLAIGQPPEVVALLRPYLAWVAVGVLPALLFHVEGTYLTAHGHTRQFLAITVAINVLNLVLDLWLVRGGLGVPALGVAGIGAATAGCAIAEWLLLSFASRRGGPLGHLHAVWRRPVAPVARRILRTGVPVGVQFSLEVWGFTAATFLMGLMGAHVLAGHQIAMNVAGMTFTVALGIGSAASVRVGQAVGRRDIAGVRRAGRTALLAGLGIGLTSAALLAGGRHAIAHLYTSDPDTAALGASFLVVAAAFQLADMVQAIGFAVLRGLDDTRVPTLFNVVGYYVVGLPIGAVAVFGLGAPPVWIWWGLTIALVLVAISLGVRFAVLSRRL